MSGKIVNNVFRASGVIAATPGGLDWSTAVVTGSTLSATAGKGYFINTTSNACTVTLPSSAETGDQIVLVDYARTWSTNNLIIDSNGNNFQGDPDTYTVDYDTAGQSLNIVYSDATKGWLPVSDDAVANAPTPPQTQKAIFAYGDTGSVVSTKNLMNSSGVIAADVTGVGTARQALAATTYGSDKAIFAYGRNSSNDNISMSNLVNSSGVVAADVTGVGTVRSNLGATTYGSSGQAIFAYGYNYPTRYSMSNLVSNVGVIATDTTGVGTARNGLAGVPYGYDKGIFAYGNSGSVTSLSNLVSNSGVIASDTTGVGTARTDCAASGYGVGLAIFAFGYSGGSVSMSNLVSNSGVIASDVTGVGTARTLSASSYGGDKGAFAYGETDDARVSIKNLVSNTGVISADVTGVGTGKNALAAAGYSTSA